MNFHGRLAIAAVAGAMVCGLPALAQAPEAPQQKGLGTKAIEAAKSAARGAGDILTRVPCLPAKGLKNVPGSLPRVARRIAAGEPVTIVAFGLVDHGRLRYGRRPTIIPAVLRTSCAANFRPPTSASSTAAWADRMRLK